MVWAVGESVCVFSGVGGLGFGGVILSLVESWCDLGRVCSGSRVLRSFPMALIASV